LKNAFNFGFTGTIIYSKEEEKEERLFRQNKEHKSM